jgi:hypothetical protein
MSDGVFSFEVCLERQSVSLIMGYIFRAVNMNLMSQSCYSRKIAEANAEKKLLSAKYGELERKEEKYDIIADEIDEKGIKFREVSEELKKQMSVVRTRIKKLKKSIRLRRKSETLKNKSHTCFVFGVCERQIGGRLHKGIGHKLLCAGRDATDIRWAGSSGISSWIFTKCIKCNEDNTLKGQSHEKVYEFLTWDGSFKLN